MIGDYYEPSEKIDLSSLLTSSCIALLLGSILQCIVVIIGAWKGSLFIELILTSLLALFSIIIFRIAIILSKLRNIVAARITALLLSLVFYYVHVSAFFALLSYSNQRGIASPTYYIDELSNIVHTILTAMLHPTTVWNSFLNLYTTNAQPMILLFTLGSLFVTILLPQFSAKRTLQPFCEEQNTWMKATPSTGQMLYFEQDELDEFETQLEEGHTMDLLSRPLLKKQESSQYSILVFYKVKKKNTGFIEIRNCKPDPESNQKLIVTTYIPPIMLGQEKADELEDYINSGKKSRNIFLNTSPEKE